jgi:hypothetical protein
MQFHSRVSLPVWTEKTTMRQLCLHGRTERFTIRYRWSEYLDLVLVILREYKS